MKVFCLLALFAALLLNNTTNLHAQSGAMYICNDCLYESLNDGQTIKFNRNGSVAVNGKLDKRFRCRNNDGVVELRFNGKLINELVYDNEALRNGRDCTLRDKRGLCYEIIGCGKNARRR